MSEYSLLGYAAAFCTTAAFLPQVIHTLKSRNTDSISIGMYILFVTGVGLWLVYGVVKHDWPIIIANGLTFVLAATILVVKIAHLLAKR